MTDRRIKLFQYKVKLDTNKSYFNESINLPSDVEEIIAVCPDLANGTACVGNNLGKPACQGFLSIYNEKTNDQIINTVNVVNDLGHLNFKAIDVINFPEKNNLNYTLRLVSVDNMQDCTLRILFKYVKRER